MIVVDTSVLVPFILRTSRFPAVARVCNKDPFLVVPDGWRLDFLDALSDHVRSGRGTVEDAHNRLAAAQFLVRFSHEVFDDTFILTTAIETKLSVWDTIYVLTAKRLGAKLVTDKLTILRACPDTAVSLEIFGAD